MNFLKCILDTNITSLLYPSERHQGLDSFQGVTSWLISVHLAQKHL